MKILLIDNFDSFTFNLYQLIGELLLARQNKFTLDVARNNEITIGEIKKRDYGKIVISPGPGNPADQKYFGVCADVLTKLGKHIPIFGVCLGMQGIAYYFGGKIISAKQPMHGKVSTIKHDGKSLFTDLPQKLEVMRYHSLVADPASLPECLEITSRSLDSNEIMGLRHKKFPVEGIQFHPESFATEGGREIIGNFLFK